MTSAKDFSYCRTSDLSIFVRVKIESLEGAHESLDVKDSELYVAASLCSYNQLLTPVQKTRLRPFTSQINEWLEFSIYYSNLPLNSTLEFSVIYLKEPRKEVVVASGSIALFSSESTLKKGKYKVTLQKPNTVTVVPDGEMKRLEELMRKLDRGDIPSVPWLDLLVYREIEKINQREITTSKSVYLNIELPLFDFPLVYYEKEYIFPPHLAQSSSDICIIQDSEANRNDNPVENKHRKLVRSHRTTQLDRELKPNARIRDDLNTILRYPPTKILTPEEKDLIWKFRFSLSKDKKALTKFIKSVEWNDAIEEKQAVELLHSWVEIDVEDALELLGPTFTHPEVRYHGVAQLNKAEDDELQLYLLQLVQALKFEGLGTFRTKITDSPLVEFLIDRAVRNPVLGNYFHWYLRVEMDEANRPGNLNNGNAGSSVLARMYAKVALQFMTSMMSVPDAAIRRDVLKRQEELVASLNKISKEIKAMKEPRNKKVERLRAYLSDPKNGLLSFPPMPLPLDAQVQITGIIAEKASVFKSSLSPLRLHFSCVDGNEYQLIFKSGDDLRQDQLVVQIITLMDRLLRKENLDLKLTPYKVLATGADHGMFQFVPAQPLATILAQYNNSLLNFLRENNPVPENDGRNLNGLLLQPSGIPAAVMDTYIKSCAGYSVIMYLLGVGDRHLDNLLLDQSGRLIHVDFGFILGRDPKPFPPPMKLCKEMVEAMGGGSTSQQYSKFREYCFITFNSLRKSANLVLNLFALMVTMNIPDIAIEPDKVVFKVQEKYRLDLSDEEAIQYFQALISESVSALFPQVFEKIHQWAQYWRGP
ncbi:Phosphatidylinositol (PI) 3-kinase [Nowakowskiella sp. JEL0407]|nr:Phosphatidylinositol (PI) 3-kinase [Nowakowskiella sp. JEL0407]